VVGSAIANVLGAFAVGLLLHPGHVAFDRSAKVHATIWFGVTTVFAAVVFTGTLNREAGFAFLAGFVVYLALLASATYRGVSNASTI
jgi:Ca2+/Na+ antiporter